MEGIFLPEVDKSQPDFGQDILNSKAIEHRNSDCIQKVMSAEKELKTFRKFPQEKSRQFDAGSHST